MTHDLFTALCSQISAEMERLHIPGLALGIIYGGEKFTADFGITNVENPLPVTADTLFQVGSITKTFTSLAAMRLVENGFLELDKPVKYYLPSLRLADKQVAEQVTLRHLFTHTAGWTGDYFDDSGAGDDALGKVVERMVNLPQETPLGEIWSYNNAGFYLAGRLVEIASGKSYEAAVQELVLNPLGMQSSFFFARDVITHRFVVGHDAVYPAEQRQPKVLRPWEMSRAENAMGGLASTVDDLLIYAQFHMGDGCNSTGEQLLARYSLESLHSPQLPAANGEWIGLTWFSREIQGERIIRHGGATNGQQAILQIVPGRHFALVVLANSDRGSELYTPLAERALNLFLGLEEPKPEPRPATDEELVEFSGCYSAAAEDLELQPGEGFWILNEIPKGGFPTPESAPPPPPPPVRLQPVAADQVMILDEPGKGNLGEFLRGPDGSVTWFRFGGRVHRRL